MKLIDVEKKYSWGWHLRILGIGFPYPRINTVTSRLWKKRFDGLTEQELMILIGDQYHESTGKVIDWNAPKTFTDKLNWLKVHYHNPQMAVCADKVKARDFFLQKNPGREDLLVRQIGAYDAFDDMDITSFPRSFVLKSNWGSGAQMIVRDKEGFNQAKARRIVSRWMDPRRNHYYSFFEWGYKDIVPKIVVEEFLGFEYKLEFFCFQGQPRFFWIVLDDKTKATSANFYELDWRQIPVSDHYPNFSREIAKPNCYPEMLETARKLSKDFPFVRCDFYVTKNGYRFSEMTFYHWAGYCKMNPDEYDLIWGNMLELPTAQKR